MKKIVYLLSCLAISGCSSLEKAPFYCPTTGFMAGAEENVFFVPTYTDEQIPATLDDVSIYTKLDNLQGECKLSDNNVAALDFTFDIMAQKKDNTQDTKTQEVNYFVAVLDQEENIIQRARFRTTVNFEDSDQTTLKEEQKIKIPLGKETDAGNYKVAIGFIMTEAQALLLQTESSKQ